MANATFSLPVLVRNIAWGMTLIFALLTGFLAFRHGAVMAVFISSTLMLAWLAAALFADNLRLRRLNRSPMDGVAK